MKNKHTKEILSLLSTDSYITAETLAKKLNVSEKTVRLKINKINRELKQTNIEIVSKPRNGYILLNHQNDNLPHLDTNIVNDFEYRALYIFEYLINNNDKYIKSEILSEALDISKTTLTNTLKIIEKNIKLHNLKISRRPNYGIKLEGSEFNIRNSIIEYYVKQEILDKKVCKETITKTANIVIDFIKDKKIKFSEINLENFIQYITISIIRIKKDKIIKEYNDEILKDITNKELELAQVLTNSLEQEFNIKFNDIEVIFIAIHLTSKSLLQNQENFIIKNNIDNIVMQMLEVVYNNLKIDFRDDFNLILLLKQHLTPMNIRIKYNIMQKNTMLKEIKKNYGLAYLIASESATVLKKYYDKEISEDEIGFLALLFQISLEEKSENKDKINILIVCGSGKTTSKLLMFKYKKEFSNYIDNIYTTDLIGLKDFDFSKVHYILSTVSISIKVPVPIIEIGLFLENEDILKVKSVLKLSKNNTLYEYYKKELFSTTIKGDNREEIIKNICSEISKYENIPDNFYNSIIERELLAETDFGNLVAIPHPIELITDKTFIYIAVLDKPIIWYKNNVQLIFLISISKYHNSNLEEFYKDTIDFLLNETKIKDLISNPSFDNFIKLFNNKDII